ncbi:TPA: glycosyltransferase family 2 protein [Candidatus Woesearchaeota archaeon]|nr:glycosyltransferase family 2 protein [Candidatus Woesearchaeota archaeon]
MKCEVSVIICTYNDGKYLDGCIGSILNQTYRNFELIIVNDNSQDTSEKIIQSYKNKRIRYIKNKRNMGISKSRNKAIEKSSGQYIFITDGDCHPEENWLEIGVNYFKKNDCLAIEGQLVYNEDGYKPTLEDRNVENLNGGMWMTANMAYRREVFKKIKFNSRYAWGGDRALALDINKIKKIPFVQGMKVYHYKKTRNVSEYLKETMRIISKVKVLKNNKESGMPIVLYPKFFLVLLFPPLILLEFFYGRIKNLNDLKLLPFVWVKAVYLRYLIWKTAFEEKIFVI